MLRDAQSSSPHSSDTRAWRRATRTALIERRLAQSAAERTAHHDAVTKSLEAALHSPAGRLIGFYWPFKGEYDVRPVARRLHASGARLALPVVVEKARPLIFREWAPGIAMTHGIWNIPIPANGEPVTPDILIVPLVGFDSQRYRLGYGGGYYDRTLAAMAVKPRTIAVGHAFSRLPTINPQPHDIPMDIILTESETIPLRCVRTEPSLSDPGGKP